jgi:hypothetical protein
MRVNAWLFMMEVQNLDQASEAFKRKNFMIALSFMVHTPTEDGNNVTPIEGARKHTFPKGGTPLCSEWL